MVNNNYLPLIEIFTVNKVIKIFTVDKTTVNSYYLLLMEKLTVNNCYLTLINFKNIITVSKNVYHYLI